MMRNCSHCKGFDIFFRTPYIVIGISKSIFNPVGTFRKKNNLTKINLQIDKEHFLLVILIEDKDCKGSIPFLQTPYI